MGVPPNQVRYALQRRTGRYRSNPPRASATSLQSQLSEDTSASRLAKAGNLTRAIRSSRVQGGTRTSTSPAVDGGPRLEGRKPRRGGGKQWEDRRAAKKKSRSREALDLGCLTSSLRRVQSFFFQFRIDAARCGQHAALARPAARVAGGGVGRRFATAAEARKRHELRA